MVNGPDHIFYEMDGHVLQWDRSFYSKEKLEDVIQQIVASGNKIVNEANPIVDTRLKDGSRVNIVLSPIAVDGSVITIRKFPEHPMKMNQLIQYGAISKEAADFLKTLVYSGYNIFVSGGTGAGKTTFLNALSDTHVFAHAAGSYYRGRMQRSRNVGYVTSHEYRTRRQPKYRTCKFQQRYAQTPGDNGSYGNGASNSSDPQPDCFRH